MVTYRVSIDCKENDPVDRRCGGPHYLGFDFFIKSTSEKAAIAQFRTLLEKYEIPIIRIDARKEPTKLRLWSLKTIEKNIKDNAKDMI